MYRAYLTPYQGGTPGEDVGIYDPRSDVLRILSGSLETMCNGAGGLDITIPRDHPSYSQLVLGSGIVTVATEDSVIFRGRIASISVDVHLSKSIHVEGVLSLLNDSAAPAYRFPEDFSVAGSSGNVVRAYLQILLDWHNSQVQPWQRLQLGDVTVTDPNNYITRSKQAPACLMDVLREATYESSLGGYLVVRYSGRNNIIDYLAELPLDAETQIEFSKNLLDILTVDDAEELYTAVLPVGANGLTIDSLPNGQIEPGIYKIGNAVFNSPAEGQYGTITKVVKFTDITDPANLLQRARIMARTAGHAQSLDVSAVDLHQNGAAFRAGRRYRLNARPHGIAADLGLTRLKVDLLDPTAADITFGTAQTTITDAGARELRDR